MKTAMARRRERGGAPKVRGGMWTTAVILEPRRATRAWWGAPWGCGCADHLQAEAARAARVARRSCRQGRQGGRQLLLEPAQHRRVVDAREVEDVGDALGLGGDAREGDVEPEVGQGLRDREEDAWAVVRVHVDDGELLG